MLALLSGRVEARLHPLADQVALVLGDRGQDGDEPGEAGNAPGEHVMEVDVTLEAMGFGVAEI